MPAHLYHLNIFLLTRGLLKAFESRQKVLLASEFGPIMIGKRWIFKSAFERMIQLEIFPCSAGNEVKLNLAVLLM